MSITVERIKNKTYVKIGNKYADSISFEKLKALTSAVIYYAM